jgi:hypothetical protein
MSTNKSRKKGTVTTAARNGRKVASSVLNRLAPGEVASVLQILLDRHPNLTREAQEIAAGLVSSFGMLRSPGKVSGYNQWLPAEGFEPGY